MVNVPNEGFSIATFDHWEYVLPFGDEWMNQAQSYWPYGKSKYVNFMDPQWNCLQQKEGPLMPPFFGTSVLPVKHSKHPI